MKTRTISLENIPFIDKDQNASFYLNGKVTLSQENTEVEVTDIVDVDDNTLPLSETPCLLLEKFEDALIAEAVAMISSPTFEWEDA